MTRQRNEVPTYRRHGKTGRAVVSVYRTDGSRTEILLPGKYGSAESKAEYERMLAQLRANDGKLPMVNTSSDITIAELVVRFMTTHVDKHYRRADGTPTGEKANFAKTFRPLARLYGPTPAREFTPVNLQIVRDAMISGSWMTDAEKAKRKKTRGGDGTTCRRVTNLRISRIKHLFKWAGANAILSPSVWHALQCVAGLQAGRGAARESKLVEPVPLETVEDTLKHLPDVFAAIVKVQLYSGARAGEILQMHTADIDQAAIAGVWLFTPRTHKNAHRGHSRCLALGPKAQLALRPYLRQDSPEELVFKPGMGRPRKQLKRRPEYDVGDYDKAIYRAAKKAGVKRWASHQLRHLAASLAERETSLEGARAYLGQKNVNQTTHYAGIDVKAAAAVAAKIG